MANLWRRAGVYIDLCYTFPAVIGVGTAAGWLADRFLPTKPYLTLAGFLLGLTGAFWYLFKMLSVMSRKGDKGPGVGG